MPEPDERGYDASKHSPEALRKAWEVLAGSRAGAVAAARGAGWEEGGGGMDGVEDGPDVEEPYYDMPDVPAVDMM